MSSPRLVPLVLLAWLAVAPPAGAGRWGDLKALASVMERLEQLGRGCTARVRGFAAGAGRRVELDLVLDLNLGDTPGLRVSTRRPLATTPAGWEGPAPEVLLDLTVDGAGLYLSARPVLPSSREPRALGLFLPVSGGGTPPPARRRRGKGSFRREGRTLVFRGRAEDGQATELRLGYARDHLPTSLVASKGEDRRVELAFSEVLARKGPVRPALPPAGHAPMSLVGLARLVPVLVPLEGLVEAPSWGQLFPARLAPDVPPPGPARPAKLSLRRLAEGTPQEFAAVLALAGLFDERDVLAGLAEATRGVRDGLAGTARAARPRRRGIFGRRR